VLLHGLKSLGMNRLGERVHNLHVREDKRVETASQVAVE
jgi:hypothetical protein